MKKDYLQPFIKRIRKSETNFHQFLRLHRAEYGHSFKKKIKSNDYYGYYPNISDLLKTFSNFLKVRKNNLILGLGAESIIKDVLSFFSKSKKRIGFLLPNYFMYTIYSKFYGYKIFNLNIDPEKTENLNISSIKKFLNKTKIDIFLIVNPSHPFEKNWNLKEIFDLCKFCKKKKITLIIDEVYQGLGSKTAKNLINKFDNLLLIGSISKNLGLPALRVGYLISSKKNIERIESLRLAIELPTHSIQIANSFLKNRKLILKIKKKIIDARRFTHKEFKKRNIKSFGNFGNSVTFKLKNKKITKKIGNFLERNKILVNYKYQKPFDNFINLTTTNTSNLKIFFKKFDQVR